MSTSPKRINVLVPQFTAGPSCSVRLAVETPTRIAKIQRCVNLAMAVAVSQPISTGRYVLGWRIATTRRDAAFGATENLILGLTTDAQFMNDHAYPGSTYSDFGAGFHLLQGSVCQATQWRSIAREEISSQAKTVVLHVDFDSRVMTFFLDGQEIKPREGPVKVRESSTPFYAAVTLQTQHRRVESLTPADLSKIFSKPPSADASRLAFEVYYRLNAFELRLVAWQLRLLSHGRMRTATEIWNVLQCVCLYIA